MKSQEDEQQLMVINPPDKLESIIEENSEMNLFDLYRETLWMRTKIFLLNYLNFILYHVTTSVILSFINNKYIESSNYIIGIGTSYSIYLIFMDSILLGSSSAVEINGTQAYSSGKYKLFGHYMHRIRIIAYSGILIVSLIIFFSCEYFLKLYDYDVVSTRIIRNLIGLRGISAFLDIEYLILNRYLQIIDKGIIVICLSILGFCFIFPYCYFFITLMNIGEFGIGLVLILNSITNLIIVWIYVLIYKPLEKSIFFFEEKSFYDFIEMAKITIPLIFSSLLDNINLELMSVFFNYYKKDYSAFFIAYSIYLSIGGFSNSFGILTNLMVSLYNAKGNLINLTKMFWYLLIDGLIISSLFLIITITSRHFLISTSKIKDVNTANETAIFLTLLCFCFVLDTIEQICINTMKGLKRINTIMILYLILNILNIILMYNGYRLYEGKGIILGYILNDIFGILLYSLFLYFINWQECIDESKLELERDKLKID